MSIPTFHTNKTPELNLAEILSRQIQQWAQALGAQSESVTAVGYAVRELSLHNSKGDVCIDLSSLPNLTDSSGHSLPWPSLILNSKVVGTPDATYSYPLILDHQGRLYLHKHFDFEKRLAIRLLKAQTQHTKTALPDRSLKNKLDALFASNKIPLAGKTDWQKIAVALALHSTLTIISGGPGTGKTTTVVKLLACLLGLNPTCRIALCAPTGRAAARMSDSIRLQLNTLPDHLTAQFPTESFTIHRLLGSKPYSNDFTHHAGNPLNIDVIVVDEASMLDLALATKLLEAVPTHAKIVLLGDRDQLSAVEEGNVFSEISADPSLSHDYLMKLSEFCSIEPATIATPKPRIESKLRDCVVWLSHSYRFGSTSNIADLAGIINAGDSKAALAWLQENNSQPIRYIEDNGSIIPKSAMQHMIDGYHEFIAAIQSKEQSIASIFPLFLQFKVLCAVREGSRGCEQINAKITEKILTMLNDGTSRDNSEWFHGRPIIVLSNDYSLKLFNGDIGMTLTNEAGELMVYFPNFSGGFREISPLRLPHHETAFAMTIHKAQGSEFNNVFVQLPHESTKVLSRQLLYTAVTRAKQHVTVCGSQEAISSAIKNPISRQSGLISRIIELQ